MWSWTTSSSLLAQAQVAQRGGHALARVVHEGRRHEQADDAAGDHAGRVAPAVVALGPREPVPASQLVDDEIAGVVPGEGVVGTGVAQPDDEAARPAGPSAGSRCERPAVTGYSSALGLALAHDLGLARRRDLCLFAGLFLGHAWGQDGAERPRRGRRGG